MASLAPPQAVVNDNSIREVPPIPPEKDRRPSISHMDTAHYRTISDQPATTTPRNNSSQFPPSSSQQNEPSRKPEEKKTWQKIGASLKKHFEFDEIPERIHTSYRNPNPRTHGDYPPSNREVLRKDGPSSHQSSRDPGRNAERAYNPSPWEVKANEQAQIIQQQGQVIQQLQKVMEEQHDAFVQVKESANKMQLAMDNKELYLGQQASDDILIGKFAALMRSIKTWSQLFPRIQIDNLKLQLKNEEMIDEVLHVFPGCPRVENLEKVLNDPQKRRLFIRGWIGLIITKHFFRSLPDEDYPAFNGAVDVWLQERTSESVAALETVFFYAGQEKRPLVSTKELHDWRALTMNLLSKMTNAESLSVDLEDVLQCFSADTVYAIRKLAPDTTREELEGGLTSILRDAVKLSRLLRCQRAYWFVRFPMVPPPTNPEHTDLTMTLRFDGNYMEDRDDEGDDEGSQRNKTDTIVEMVVQPGLTKCGNAEGENFGRKATIEKALVSCF